MYRGYLSAVGILAVALGLGLFPTACDLTEGSESEPTQVGSDDESRESPREGDPREGDPGEGDDGNPVARAQLETTAEELRELVGFDPLPVHLLSSLEVLVIPSQDTIAITGASNGFLAPFPSNIMTMDEPSIADGVLIATKIRDLGNEIVGFGTEQEVFDSVNAMSETTFTFTLPDRGTIMLKQQEDFSGPFGEVADMIANQEFIRTYNPPLVFVTTVPTTGGVVGGTGEFQGAQGYMVEIDIVHQINLIDRILDLTVVVPIGFL